MNKGVGFGPLNYRADVRTLNILLSYAALFGVAWTWNPAGLPRYLLIGVLCIAAWLSAVIAHNTVHTRVFKYPWMNSAFQVWVSLSYGFPISDYIPGHNLSHHRYLQLAEDVMRTSKVRFRWNLLNLLFFFFAVTPSILRSNARYNRLRSADHKQWHRQRLLEVAIVWSAKAALILIDWRRAVVFLVIPHLVANWGIVTINFLQHDGCDAEHRSNHSRNFVGPVLNYLGVNNGYHAIHHLQPGLHWSLLPEAHSRLMAPTVHPALAQPSLPVYFFKTFVYPGKRLKYDGSPYEFAEAGPDRDWALE